MELRQSPRVAWSQFLFGLVSLRILDSIGGVLSQFDVCLFMRRVSFGVALAAFSAILPAIAAPIQYQVTVDTSAISGTAGNIDLQFNRGDASSQNAFVTISSFSSTGGSLTGAASTSGDVTGVLPGTLTIDNSPGFNDYFQPFTFGSSFQFLLTLDGPAIESPDHAALIGSSFGLGLFDSTGSTPLLTTDPNGFAGTVDIDRDGVVTTTVFPPTLAGGTPVVTFSTPVTVPEPSTITLLSGSLLLFVSAANKSRRGLSSRRG